MIIQCEQCQAKFRLDDSKVTDKGVKVRCAKCKHVFAVRKEQPEKEPPVFGSSLEQTSAPSLQEVAVPPRKPEIQEPSPAFSFGSAASEESADSTVGMVPSPFDATASDATSTSAVADVGDQAMIQAPPGLDFSDDDDDEMFGAIVPPAVEEPGDSVSFDYGTDNFADSMETGGADSGQKGSSFSLEATGNAPFTLGEIDFGDELTSVAVQQVNPDELKPSQEKLFAPLVEAQEKPADDDLKKAFLGDVSTTQEELPPLPIASRRKQSLLYTGVIAAVALLVVGALGYFGFSSLSSDKGMVAQETGKISVRAVTASYVENKTIGTLLVISGEALNEYSKPRAALQVKGVVYDAAGQVLTSKSAYGGNPLTQEQLESMPLDKIEAAMSNQFGDSLANLEVAPGKAVPFMIVIAKPPKEGKDFGVQPAGSTVATGKQP